MSSKTLDGWNIFVRCLQRHMLQRDEQPLLPSHSNEQTHKHEKLQHEWMKKLQTSIRATSIQKSFLLSRAALVLVVQSGGRCKWTCKCSSSPPQNATLEVSPNSFSSCFSASWTCRVLLLGAFFSFFSVRQRKTEKTHFPSLANLPHLRAAVYFKVRPAPSGPPDTLEYLLMI